MEAVEFFTILFTVLGLELLPVIIVGLYYRKTWAYTLSSDVEPLKARSVCKSTIVEIDTVKEIHIMIEPPTLEEAARDPDSYSLEVLKDLIKPESIELSGGLIARIVDYFYD